MKGTKRKSEDLDEIPGSSNKVSKSSQPTGVNENLENGLIKDLEESLNFVQNTLCSPSQAEKNINDDPNTGEKCMENILRIVTELAIPESDSREIIDTVTNDLKKALFNLSKPFCISPFGSFVSGLASCGSDLDFFLNSEYKSTNELQHLLQTSANYLRKSKMFDRVFTVPAARVPIIKFTHKSTSCECDLSFSNEIGVRNSLLVQFYLSLNANLKPLVLFLKYLLELYELHGCQKITTYMLFWLVVYYMQQRDFLPPVQTVRDRVYESYIINGWDCRVPTPFIIPVTDSLTLFSHLKEFLKFYSEFNFLTTVISPFLACPLAVEDFESLRIPFSHFNVYLQKVQNSEDSTFNFSIMNLQDPTELNVNLTRQVQLPALNLFRSFCHRLHNFFTVEVSEKMASNSELEKVLPETIPKGYCVVSKDCIQCEIHRLTINRLPENHPLRQTFQVNGVLFFAKRLENIMKSTFECDVQTTINDQTVRIDRNRKKGNFRRKVIPVAYFRCSRRKKIADKIQSDGDFSAEDELFPDLFMVMDTTFGGDEIRIRVEGSAAFLRLLGTSMIKLLVQISE